MAGTEARPTGTEARPTGTEARPTSTGARPTECWLLACRSKLRLRFEGSYLLQRMTAQRNDLMTPKASDPHRLTPCALHLAPLLNPKSPLLPLLGLD